MCPARMRFLHALHHVMTVLICKEYVLVVKVYRLQLHDDLVAVVVRKRARVDLHAHHAVTLSLVWRYVV